MNVGRLLDSSLTDAYQHELNQAVAGISFYIVPMLIIGLYFLLQPILTNRHTRGYSWSALLGAAGIIILGMVMGFFVGVYITFESCFKRDCTMSQQVSPLIIGSGLSLLMSVPIVRKYLAKKRSTQPSAPNGSPVTTAHARNATIIGVAILLFTILLAVHNVSRAMENTKAHQADSFQREKELQQYFESDN